VLQDENELKDTLEDESLMDIDDADSGNPLAATEYVEEIYKYYRDNEVIYCPAAAVPYTRSVP
jgi:cyclin B